MGTACSSEENKETCESVKCPDVASVEETNNDEVQQAANEEAQKLEEAYDQETAASLEEKEREEAERQRIEEEQKQKEREEKEAERAAQAKKLKEEEEAVRLEAEREQKRKAEQAAKEEAEAKAKEVAEKERKEAEAKKNAEATKQKNQKTKLDQFLKLQGFKDVNTAKKVPVTNKKQFPLYVAIKEGNDEMVEIMLNNKADTTQKTGKGKTFLEKAKLLDERTPGPQFKKIISMLEGADKATKSGA